MITVKVTQEDIDSGVRDNCNHCPVAKAILRAVGPGMHIAVYGARAAMYGGVRGLRRFIVPLNAQEFIVRFDEGETVKPLAFDLIEETVI